MKIIDARSGSEVSLGQTVRYPADPEASYSLIGVEENVLSAKAFLQCPPGSDQVVARQLQVRFTHPDHFLQKVAFIPS